MRKEKKQFVVLGLGRFGSSVAKSLCKLGHDVLAVDADENLVEEAAPFVTQAIQADATDEDALAQLDLAGFDAAIVSIGSDVRASVLVSVLCKEMGVNHVIAKAVDDLHAKVLRKVGVDRVIFPERDMGVRLARALTTPTMMDVAELSDDYHIAEVLTPDSWQRRTLMEINVRKHYGLSVVGIRRGSGFVASPGAEEKLLPGDVLLVLGRQKDIDQLDER